MRTAVVADRDDVFRAAPRQRLDQIVRKSSAAESAEHDPRAIRHIRNDRVDVLINFLLHPALEVLFVRFVIMDAAFTVALRRSLSSPARSRASGSHHSLAATRRFA